MRLRGEGMVLESARLNRLSRHTLSHQLIDIPEVCGTQFSSSVQHVIGQGALPRQQLVQLFIECLEVRCAHDRVVHMHIPGLPDSVGTVRRLVFLGGVPCATEVDERATWLGVRRRRGDRVGTL